MSSILKLSDVSSVLCIGAHCDDIEIGCGCTLRRWAREYPHARFTWAIFDGEISRHQESRRAASEILAGTGSGTGADIARPALDLQFFDFRASYFPAQYERVKDTFEALKDMPRPDVILTHRLDDRHQDHALLAQLTWNTFRSHLVLEYEIPKYEGDLAQPNLFVALDEQAIDWKADMLMRCFVSQHGRSWFRADTFKALARLRGIECAAPGGFAEGFHARKVRL